MADDQTFIFEDDKVYAVENGKVLAAANSVEELEEALDKDEDEESSESKESRNIITPTGMKGTILSKTPDMWGLEDTLTVRLENGRIAHYKVADVVEDDEVVESRDPLAELEEVINQDAFADIDSLQERQEALASVKQSARRLILGGVSDADQHRADTIIVHADNELHEIDQRFEQINDESLQKFEAPAPFQTTVVEQGGRADGAGWLDATMNDLAAEADEQDYTKLMDEGPEAFVAEQPTDVIADQGATAFAASAHIKTKTAGVDPVVRDKYEKAWLARVEQVRRAQLSERKATAKKEAKVEHDTQDDAPDESLFL